MNAPVKIANAQLLSSTVDVLKLLAQSAASSWSRFAIELPDVVDPLQYYAERTGLVATLGADSVQALIAAPFAKLREARR